MAYDYFGGRDHDVMAEHRRRVATRLSLRFRLRDASDPLDVTVEAFVSVYRMPQDVFMLLVQTLEPFKLQTTSGRAIPFYMKVLCTVFYLASGSYQRHLSTSVNHPLGQGTVSKAINEVIDLLNRPEVLTRYVRFPTTHAERVACIERNNHLGLPDVLGMLDGTLVPIFPPDKPNQPYYCRKGFTAINALIVCDASLKILTINARFAGSSNDSFVYHESGLPEVMEAAYREDHCWLLGDSGYPNLPWLMVPLLPAPPPGTPGSSYNKLHAKARNPVERCIGVLKCRWRCLLVPIHYHPAKAGRILNACAVLHNLLLENNMPLPVDYEIFIDPVEDPDANPVDPNELQMLPAELRREANANRQYLIEHAHWYLNRQ